MTWVVFIFYFFLIEFFFNRVSYFFFNLLFTYLSHAYGFSFFFSISTFNIRSIGNEALYFFMKLSWFHNLSHWFNRLG